MEGWGRERERARERERDAVVVFVPLHRGYAVPWLMDYRTEGAALLLNYYYYYDWYWDVCIG